MPTFQCTAACRSCGTLSSPKEKTRLSRAEILSVVQQAAHSGYELVVFTGGEATLVGDDLLDAIELVTELGMLSRLVTNAHWASSPVAATDMVNDLKCRGLGEINFSTGDEHARFVPLDNIFRATRSALDAGFTPSIMVETTENRAITREHIEAQLQFRLIRLDHPGRYIRINESPWMPLNSRRREQYAPGMAIDANNVSSCVGCDSVLSTTTVQADGTIGACCGLGLRLIPELHLGSIAETTLSKAYEEATQDVLKRWLRVEGPERILAWASGHDASIEWEGQYAHRCQACLRLYTDETVGEVIRERYLEKVPDIFFAEWLLFSDGTGAAGEGPSPLSS